MSAVQQELDKWEHLDVEAIFKRSGVDLTAAQITKELDPDAINAEGARTFLARHGAQSDYNSHALVEWCTERDVPTTCRNLEIAHEDLRKKGLLDLTPVTVTDSTDGEQQVVFRRQATPVESVPVAHDPAKLRTMPLDQLKRLAFQRPAAPTQEGMVDIVEDGLTEPDAAAQVEPVKVETESDLKKLPLAELRRRATADRIARRTSAPHPVIQI